MYKALQKQRRDSNQEISIILKNISNTYEILNFTCNSINANYSNNEVSFFPYRIAKNKERIKIAVNFCKVQKKGVLTIAKYTNQYILSGGQFDSMYVADFFLSHKNKGNKVYNNVTFFIYLYFNLGSSPHLHSVKRKLHLPIQGTSDFQFKTQLFQAEIHQIQGSLLQVDSKNWKQILP